jgi:hypothetical protein
LSQKKTPAIRLQVDQVTRTGWEERSILLVLDELVGSLLLPGAQLLDPHELAPVRVVEAVGRVADAGDAQRDEDLPAVPRPKPPAKTDHATERERSTSSVRSGNPPNTSPTEEIPHSPRRREHGGGKGAAEARSSFFGGSESGSEVSVTLAWGPWGMKSSRRHRRRGGRCSRGEPGLITNQLDSREGVNSRNKKSFALGRRLLIFYQLWALKKCY